MPDRLAVHERLERLGQIRSPNGRFRLIMQADGNLVLYDGAPAAGSAVWATDTWQNDPSGRATYAVMQDDGHLVLYDEEGAAVWGSGVWGPGLNDVWLVLRDDGDLSIHANGDQLVWTAGTGRPPGPAVALVEAATADVSRRTRMTITATLYRNDLLTVECRQQGARRAGSLRGQVLVVHVDDHGRAIWVSRVFEYALRRSTATFTENVPSAVALHTASLHLLQGDVLHRDGPSFAELRTTFVHAIRSTEPLPPGVAESAALL